MCISHSSYGSILRKGLRTREGTGARHWLRAWSKHLASRVRAPSREIFASRGREQNIYRV